MSTRTLVITIATGFLLLGGCANLKEDLPAAQAKANCDGRQWPTVAALADCHSVSERPVWQQDEPDTLDLFDRFDRRRHALAVAFDRKEITLEQLKQGLDGAKTELSVQFVKWQDYKREKSAATAQAWSDALSAFVQGAAQGVAIAAQTRANADAAAAQSLQPNRIQIQHTNCQTVGNTVQCTTVTY
jgi:hypothetical protein